MTKILMSTDSVLPEPGLALELTLTKAKSIELVRMAKYKGLAVAFSYPDENFFKFFPQLLPEKEKLISLYDRLFRANEIWLYTTEYLAKNEFQRSRYLADIMGFYIAFKVEPKEDRPDSLCAEFEFMHYLIFKRFYALKNNIKDAKGKVKICFDAEKKFFNEYINLAARKIADRVFRQTKNNFYADIAKELLEFLSLEEKVLA